MQQQMTLDDIVLSRLEPNPENVSPLFEATLEEQRLEGGTLRMVVKTIPRDVVALTIDVSNSNLAKLYKRKYLSRIQSEDISDLTTTWAQINDVFMNQSDLIGEWLEQPIPSLNGRNPASLLHSLAGRKVLREQLNRLKHGDFS